MRSSILIARSQFTPPSIQSALSTCNQNSVPSLLQHQNPIKPISHLRFNVAVIGSQNKHVSAIDTNYLRFQFISHLLLRAVFMKPCPIDLNRKQHSPTYLVIYGKIDGRHRTGKLFLSLIQPVKVGEQVTKPHLRNYLQKPISRLSKNVIQKSPHDVLGLVPTISMNPRSKFV